MTMKPNIYGTDPVTTGEVEHVERERCPRCDRPIMSEREWRMPSSQVPPGLCRDLDANCAANAVDWRARALAAEGERDAAKAAALAYARALADAREERDVALRAQRDADEAHDLVAKYLDADEGEETPDAALRVARERDFLRRERGALRGAPSREAERRALVLAEVVARLGRGASHDEAVAGADAVVDQAYAAYAAKEQAK